MWNTVKRFFPSPSSRPRPSRSAEQNCGDNSTTTTTTTPGRGKNGQGIHSIISSALWAIARTPALVMAVERVETNFEQPPDLSCLLKQMGHENLDDASKLRETTQAAEAFLEANRMKLWVYSHMEPMDGFRGIFGLCGDSDHVLEEAVQTIYRTSLECLEGGCGRFETVGKPEKEERLLCKTPEVQVMLDLRSTAICDACGRESAVKRKVVEKVPPCFVATWCALCKAASGQDCLLMQTSNGEECRFKLSVMIAKRDNKFVCMFREGHDHYRVEGGIVKRIAATEWQNVQPCLALFSRQPPSAGCVSPSSACLHGAGLRTFGSSGDGKASGKKRRLEDGSDNGQQFRYVGKRFGDSRKTERSATSVEALAASAAAAEIIEVDDNDSDRGDVNTPRGGGGDDEDGGVRRTFAGSCSQAEATRYCDPPGPGPGVLEQVAWSDRGSSHDSGGRCISPADSNTNNRTGGSSLSSRIVSSPLRESRLHLHGNTHGKNQPSEDLTTEDKAEKEAKLNEEDDDDDDDDDVQMVKIDQAHQRLGDTDGANFAASLSSPSRSSTSLSSSPPSKAPAATTAPEAAKRGVASSGWLSRKCLPDSSRGSRYDSPDNRNDGSGTVSRGSVIPPATSSSSSSSLLQQRSRNETLPPLESREHQIHDVHDDDDGDDDDAAPSASALPTAASKTHPILDKLARFMPTTQPPGSKKRTAVGTPATPQQPSLHPSAAGAWLSSISVSKTSMQSGNSCRGGRRLGGDTTSNPGAAAAARAGVRGGGVKSLNGQKTILAAWQREERGIASQNTPVCKVGSGDGESRSGSDDFDEWKFPGSRGPAPQAMGASRGETINRSGGSQAIRGSGGREVGSGYGPWGLRRGEKKVTEDLTGADESCQEMDDAKGDGFPPGKASPSGGVGGTSSATRKTSVRKRTGGGSSSTIDSDQDDEWIPPGSGRTNSQPMGGGLDDAGGDFQAVRRRGLRSREKKVTEDLTGADESCLEMEDAKGDGTLDRWVSSFARGSGSSRVMRDDATLTTIRGINLQQDHFDRIVDSDGWLTSQIIDIRVKQLQELYPQHLYFDTSFFGFLCPATEKGGAFVVDYERVAGWTKRSRLPGGKSSLFDVQKLFIPINQGNVHWVLVVVDMAGGDHSDGGDGGDSVGVGVGEKSVSFFDSFGRDGTPYVEAVQQYLISELSSRNKTRQDRFTPRPLPPPNAPRQRNSSDCGVLMLHVMEELSAAPVSELQRLSQEEIMSLRLQLVAKIRE